MEKEIYLQDGKEIGTYKLKKLRNYQVIFHFGGILHFEVGGGGIFLN